MTALLVLTVPEVAAELRCSTDSVYAMCADGILDHRRIGRRKIIIPRRALLEFLGHEDAPAATNSEGVVALHGRADQGGAREAYG